MYVRITQPHYVGRYLLIHSKYFCIYKFGNGNFTCSIGTLVANIRNNQITGNLYIYTGIYFLFILPVLRSVSILFMNRFSTYDKTSRRTAVVLLQPWRMHIVLLYYRLRQKYFLLVLCRVLCRLYGWCLFKLNWATGTDPLTLQSK